MKHNDVVNSARFSSDGKWVVTASEDYTAQVWDAQTGQPVGQPMKHKGAVFSASFSQDSKWVVTASQDKTARVWDAQSGQPVGQLMKHEDGVNSASFNLDGKWVVTASADHTARVWDAIIVKQKAPSWLSKLLEKFGGRDLNLQGGLEPFSNSIRLKFARNFKNFPAMTTSPVLAAGWWRTHPPARSRPFLRSRYRNLFPTPRRKHFGRDRRSLSFGPRKSTH